jgi:cob(I)alamin adenosyltransferase
MERGLIHVYCGDGKGKTTASLGLAVRASGRGYKVLVVQFLKSQETGELSTLTKLGITVIRGKEGYSFSFNMTDEEKVKCRTVQDENLKYAIAFCRSQDVDLLILDEAIGALEKNLVDRELLLGFLNTKPAGLEVVLTGRNPDNTLLELADYVSEIKKAKHPFDLGINARDGIER